MGAGRRSLAGCRVLVARAPSRATAWIDALAARGAEGVAREIFTLESMVGEARAQRSIDRIDRWDWILLTSQSGLRFFDQGLRSRSLRLDELPARFGVVGPQTAKLLEERGRAPDAIAEPPNGLGLASVLASEVAAGDSILIVTPEQSRQGLAERLAELGADVHPVPFYRNRPAAGLASVATELSARRFDAAVFGSPSSFSHLFAACGDAATRSFDPIALVAIGATTAESIREHGYDVAAVAAEPTPEGIAEAVDAALSR